MASYDSDKVAHIHRELHSHLPPESALRVKALESLLIDKGMLDARTVDAYVQEYSENIGPRLGARVVARAWLDDAFKSRLLAQPLDAIDEVGTPGLGGGHLKVIENTAGVHNLVVCTLCSCYPHSVIGIPPAWYKSAQYRARAVREPRAVLTEFGVSLSADVEVRVWDSSAELRYLVLPQRPAGTDGWDEAALAKIVSRNAMIGAARDLSPGGGSANTQTAQA